MDRTPILCAQTTTSGQSGTGLTKFTVSPYKICVSALISVFIDERIEKNSKITQRDVGMFCLVSLKLIQSLDSNYRQFLQHLSPPFVSIRVKKKVTEKINDICREGLSNLMELMANLKTISSHSHVQKSSIVGLFIRRMWLYFDKLSFSAVSQLFNSFCDYVTEKSEHKMNNTINTSIIVETRSETCPQMQFFISKQLNLIQINEKKALNPFELLEQIRTNCQMSDMAISSANSDLNDIYFLKYVNALRVNEFAAAKESLMAYFDGNNQMSRCWAALNLAILHLHFGHHEWALQAIKECISTAQESNDDKCLEFALMWISRVFAQSGVDCDLSLLLNHLQTKANELGLPYISSIAQLQSDKLKINSPDDSSESQSVTNQSSSASTPGILAVKHSMNDILMMSYSSRSALLNLYGASNLAALTSQVLLHLNVVEPVGESNVYHVNENTCIGVRNIALHLWRNAGQYSIARDMLFHLSSLYSAYKSDLNAICYKALAEIEFELNFNQCNWKSALKCIQIINSCDRMEANIKLAQLKARMGDKLKAIDLIEQSMNSEQIHKNPFLKINAMLLKAKILNDMTTVLECIDLCAQHQLLGLEVSALVELSSMLQTNGMVFQSQRILNSIMIRLLANGTINDIANAHYITAGNHFHIYEMKDKTNKTSDQSNLETALKANQRAIELWKQLEDKHALKNSYELNAYIFDKKQDISQRNYFALQVRHIKVSTAAD